MRRIRALVPLGETGIADPFSTIAAAAAVAAEHGTQAEAILLGRAVDDAAIHRAGQEGAADIHAVSHAALGTPPSVDQWLTVLASLCATETLDLLTAGPLGEELAARLALCLGAVAIGRCLSIVAGPGTVTVRRATHGGRAEVTMTTTACRVIGVMRRPSSAPIPVAAPQVTRTTLHCALPAPPEAIVTLSDNLPARRLESARIVVAGGRGMGGAEGFAQLDELARLLDAATAASLPAVDGGWATVAQQVGQSGTFVAPDIYLAVGLSGTAQHLAGLGQATRILAVNTDPDADIFRVAELGLVARWQDALPALIAELRRT